MPAKAKPGSSRIQARAWHIVLIDQEPLRTSAAADVGTAMLRLERARSAWHRFEREDKPAFNRWRAREFGALLSRGREIELQIREGEALVHEVEMEMRRFFQDPHSAYQRVMFRRENPGTAAAEEGTPTKASHGGERRNVSEFEKEALFQEWVQRSLGTHPDKMDDDAYTTSFETFKSHMFRSAAADTPVTQNGQRSPERPRVVEEGEEEQEAPPDLRVKELYRALVRRLHPDLRANGDAAVSALWHEVQEAYAAGDVARMELLLALSDLASNRMSDQTSLSQMRAVFAELSRAWRALEKSVEEAEGEDAWNFARAGADEQLRRRVQRELKANLAIRTARLDLLARTIADWAHGPATNCRVTRARQFA